MRYKYLGTLLFSILLFACIGSQAQQLPTLVLGKDSTIAVKPAVRLQTWARFMRTNPGTTVYGEAKSHIFDVSLRRVRVGLTGHITPKLFFFFNVGGNNLNYVSGRNFSLRVLDAHLDYRFGKWLQVGFGKSNWSQGSRADARSTKSSMGADSPIFQYSTVNQADDLIRLLGIYAKGQFKNFDYRFGLHNTFSIQNSSAYNGQIGQVATYANSAPALRSSAYIKYQFFEEESNRSAFSTTSYLGKKKVLALGAGFKFQDRLMWSESALSDTLYHAYRQWALDLFYDVPLNPRSGTAFTAYLSYIRLDQGPGYIRNIGLNNPATGVGQEASFNGRGNSFPMMGSSDTWFLQLGYLMARNPFGENTGQLQPVATMQYSSFDRLSDPMLVYDFCVNWYLNGHSSKFTLNYQSRPVFYERGGGIFSEERRGMWVLQYQLAI